MKAHFIALAQRIGDELCASAIWHRGRCNWVGRSLAEVDTGGPTVQALEAGLYDGSAGVGLFLAELAGLTGDPGARRAAIGALRRSLERAPRAPSLYNGRAGVGLAAWRAGCVLGEPALLQRGEAMVRQAGEHPPDRLDLLDGAAGVLLAQLRVLEDGAPASRLGQVLAAQARADGEDFVWDNERLCGGGVGPQPLTGLSHGVSGPAAALLALDAVHEDPELRRVALGALRYEDRWLFDGNWADLRDFDPTKPAREASRAMLAWCHGAGGVGLARALALGVAPTTPGLAEGLLLAALSAEARLRRVVDCSLCHGGGGLSETLLLASITLKDPRFLQAAERWWSARRPGRGWPSGLPSGAPNPALMVGSAGAGHALLRLAAPDRVASVLLPCGLPGFDGRSPLPG